MNNNMEKEIFYVYIDDIIPNRFQPRLTFDEAALNELADSIKQHGIIQPLVVRKIEDKYEIIAGERRYKAAQIAGLQKVPVVIMNLDDKESAEVAVIENIQRKDLTALEEAESYKKLLDKGYLTQDQLAARMGKTQSTIANKLRLLALDEEVKKALLNGRISERHARSLLSLKNSMQQKEVLNNIIDNRLTVKQTDELIKSMTNNPIETLDFPGLKEFPQMIPDIPVSPAETIPPFVKPTPIITAPDIPVKTPVAEDFNPIVEPIESISEPVVMADDQINITPISNVDINKIKETAIDINPVEQPADVNALLGIEIPAPTQEITPPISEPDRPRFIPQLEDEVVNMDINPVGQASTNPEPDTVTTPFGQQLVPEFEPKTYTDSLVHEFRQSNSPETAVNGIVPGNLKTAIDKVRETTGLLEKNGFKIDIEEFDFENLYQIIIKINK
ncbi:MAG: ParB/RepB/Spo0J family partition protein [Bacilli bacterium]|nr:ParB/RepB/Spo0J family partition protein [Bacilli bacterium]